MSARLGAPGDHDAPARKSLPISTVRRDGGTQHRATLDGNLVAFYAAMLASGEDFPPIEVWFDQMHYWLVDGFNRIAACESLGRTEIDCLVFHGTQEDARWASFSANAKHGQRLTSVERGRMIDAALAHPNARGLSDLELARQLHVPPSTVRYHRKRPKQMPSSQRCEDASRVVTRGGKTYTQNIENIGKYRRPRRGHAPSWVIRDLEWMRSHASTQARPAIAIFGRWAAHVSRPEDCLAATEKFCMRLAQDRVHSEHGSAFGPGM